MISIFQKLCSWLFFNNKNTNNQEDDYKNQGIDYVSRYNNNDVTSYDNEDERPTIIVNPISKNINMYK